MIPNNTDVWLTNDDGTVEATRTTSEPWAVDGCGHWLQSVEGREGGWTILRLSLREPEAPPQEPPDCTEALAAMKAAGDELDASASAMLNPNWKGPKAARFNAAKEAGAALP